MNKSFIKINPRGDLNKFTIKSPLVNVVTVFFIFLLYAIGALSILNNSIWHQLVGMVMLCSSMLLAVYLSHDCAHLSAFKNKKN